jgi:type VI secretion system protein
MSKRITYIKNTYLRWLFVLGTLELVSCTYPPEPELTMQSVSIYTDPDANQNSATAVDLVLVYDQNLTGTLGKMSASKYFDGLNQLLLDNPTLLDVWHWELVPGQIVEAFQPQQEKGYAWAAFVFANYLTPGDHRVKVAPNGFVKILLLKDDLKNLATYDVRDVRSGTTMTDAVSNPYDPDDPCASVNVAPYTPKLGPTKVVPQTPQQQALPPCPVLPPCSSLPPGTVGIPIPVVTRPLGALNTMKASTNAAVQTSMSAASRSAGGANRQPRANISQNLPAPNAPASTSSAPSSVGGAPSSVGGAAGNSSGNSTRTPLGTINTAVQKAGTAVSNVQSTVSGVQSTVGSVKSTVNSVQSTFGKTQAPLSVPKGVPTAPKLPSAPHKPSPPKVK